MIVWADTLGCVTSAIGLHWTDVSSSWNLKFLWALVIFVFRKVSNRKQKCWCCLMNLSWLLWMCGKLEYLTFGGEADYLWTRTAMAEVCPPRRTPFSGTRSRSPSGWWGCVCSAAPPGLQAENTQEKICGVLCRRGCVWHLPNPLSMLRWGWGYKNIEKSH